MTADMLDPDLIQKKTGTPHYVNFPDKLEETLKILIQITYFIKMNA